MIISEKIGFPLQIIELFYLRSIMLKDQIFQFLKFLKFFFTFF